MKIFKSSNQISSYIPHSQYTVSVLPRQKTRALLFWKTEPWRIGSWGTAEKRHKEPYWKQKRLSESLQLDQWDLPNSLTHSAIRTRTIGLNILPTTLVHSYPTLHTLSGKTLKDCSSEILRSTKSRPNDLDFWSYLNKILLPHWNKSHLSTRNFQFACSASFKNITAKGCYDLKTSNMKKRLSKWATKETVWRTRIICIVNSLGEIKKPRAWKRDYNRAFQKQKGIAGKLKIRQEK